MGRAARRLEIESTVTIPLLGDVATGQPLECSRSRTASTCRNRSGTARKVFALRVRGQSMIDAGIRDGDYLIVEPCDSADDGRTVVAEIDGHVTVKKLYRSAGGQVRLQPANPEMLPFIVGGDQVRIRGVVVGVLRKYGFKPNAGRERPGAARPAEAATARPARRAPADADTLDLSLNAIDAQIERWRVLTESTASTSTARERAEMGVLERDLQALREWYARTTKAVLRRAILADANRVIRRMQRHAAARSLDLPPDPAA
jgi:repressor LexA